MSPQELQDSQLIMDSFVHVVIDLWPDLTSNKKEHADVLVIQDANLEIFEPSLNQPPINYVQSFLNGSRSFFQNFRPALFIIYDPLALLKVFEESFTECTKISGLTSRYNC